MTTPTKIRRVRHFATAMAASMIPAGKDVFTAVFNSLDGVKNHKQRTLEIIGISLTTIWPQLKDRIDNESFDEWTFRLSAYVAESHQGDVPGNWAPDGRKVLSEISEYERKPRIRARKIKLSTFGYDHSPGLHGFRVGNGDIFLATLAWTKDGRKLVSYPARYEFVSPADETFYAKSRRELFDSWLTASTRVPYPARPERRL